MGQVKRAGRGWWRMATWCAAAAIGTGTAAAQTPEEVAEMTRVGEANVATGLAYFDAYLDLDYEAMRALLAEDAVFEDPAFDSRVTGADSIVSALERGWAGMEVTQMRETDGFASTGGWVVLRATVTGAATTADQHVTRMRSIPLVLILRIEDGRVKLHQDFPHYTCVFTQMTLQSEESLDYDEIPDCPAAVGRR